MSRRKIDEEAQQRVQDRSEELFAALANKTRISILFALAEAEAETGGGAPIAFSELYQRVGIRDSSQFNYHLKTLTDHYVERVEEGYRLRYVGRLIYRAVKAGAYNPDQILEPTTVDSDCYKCGAKLTAHYEDGRLSIECDACEDLSYRITIQPSALIDRSPEAFLRAADQQIRRDITLAANGVCSYCSGRTVPSVRDEFDAPTDNVYINHVCEQCGQRIISTTVGEILLTRTPVVAFCFDHGFDLRSKPCWEIGFCVTDEYVSVVSEDPWLVRFELPLGDELLRMTLDETLETVDSEVVARPPSS